MTRGTKLRGALFVSIGLCLTALPCAAQWETAQGGNPRRDGFVDTQGPERPRDGWVLGARTEMPLQPLTADGKVFFAEVGDWLDPANSKLRCVELATGRELWSQNLPLTDGWHPTPMAYRDGVLYAMPTVPGYVSEHLFALDASTGAILWRSARKTNLHYYASPVILPDGDLITNGLIGMPGWELMRLDHRDGSVRWLQGAGSGSNSDSAGGALFQDRFYIVRPVAGRYQVSRVDVDTGFRLYSSAAEGDPFMQVAQENLAVGRDGTVLWPSHVAGSSSLIAYRDTGSALVEIWRTPIADSWSSNVGVGPDGSIYCCSPASELQRLDPLTGAVLSRSTPLPFDVLIANLALDASGRVFGVFQAEGATPARLQAFRSDLRPLWGLELGLSPNSGPLLAADGTLIVSTWQHVVRTIEPARIAAGPCSEPASVVLRNGSGVNPVCFRSNDSPRPGETWRATVDTSVHAAPTYFGAVFHLGASSGTFQAGGELLVDLDSPRLGLVVLPVQSAVESLPIALPNRPELCGRHVTGQAFLQGPGGLVLGNALDLTIGE